jgi:hypothetical protein
MGHAEGDWLVRRESHEETRVVNPRSWSTWLLLGRLWCETHLGQLVKTTTLVLRDQPLDG